MENLDKTAEMAEGESGEGSWVTSLTRLLMGKPLLGHIVLFLCLQLKFSLSACMLPGTGDMVMNKGHVAPALLELTVDLGSQTLINIMRENKRVLRKQTLRKLFLKVHPCCYKCPSFSWMNNTPSCVCVCVCTHCCMYVYICVCVCECIYIYTLHCMYVCICIYIYTHTCVHVCLCVYIAHLLYP